MKIMLAAFLVLAIHWPAAARSNSVNYLLQPNPGSYCQIISVTFNPPGGASAQRQIWFGHEGGRVDLKAGAVVGRATDGSEISVNLEDATQVRIRFERDGREYEYDTLVGHLLADHEWPPPGRIQKVLLTSGVMIDFDLVGPGINLDDRTLYWSCKGEWPTTFSFEDIALIQIRLNSFVTDISDLANFCALAEVDSLSGGSLVVKGPAGWLKESESIIRYDGQEIPLAEVRRIQIVDCRSRKVEMPVVAEEEPGASGETTKEGFDFHNLVLMDQRVKFRELDGGRRWIEGTVTGQNPQALEVMTEEGVVSVPLEKIKTLKVSQGSGNNAGTGALIGGGIVAVAGLGLGIAMLSDDFFDTSGGDVVAVTFLGAGVGALLGGAIGAAVKTEKWEDIDKVQIGPAMAPDNSMGLALAWNF